ncbi:MAG: diguanylate cyclase [Magnetococcales bacterium]|nr:diguanylate cyclase [Magnetococcales bacterium]
MIISRVNVLCKSQLLSLLISKKLGIIDGIKLHNLNDSDITGRQLNKIHDQILACIIDLAHPLGAKYLAFVVSKQIPTLVLVDGDLAKFRQQESGSSVYFDKDGIALFRDLSDYLYRLRWNASSPVLIVNKNRIQAKLVKESLKPYHFQLEWVDSSKQAMVYLLNNPSTKIIILGGELTDSTGVEFMQQFHSTRLRESTVVLAFSSNNQQETLEEMVQAGADDFICLPKSIHLLKCRLDRAVDQVLIMSGRKKSATKDPATGICNRRAFLEIGEALMATAGRGKFSVSVGLLSVTNFSDLSKQYGITCADLILDSTTKTIREQFRNSDIIGHFGDGLFAFILTDFDQYYAQQVFDELVDRMFKLNLLITDKPIELKVQLGVAISMGNNIEEMLAIAMECLKKAANSSSCYNYK